MMEQASNRFVVVDVETANEDMASICSIGVAVFHDGHVVDTWYSLVNPEDDFSEWNTDIHDLDEVLVAEAPTFPEIAPTLNRWFQGAVVVTHTAFDRTSLSQAAQKYGLAPLEYEWLDSAKMARRAWEDCARKGYGLKKLCKRIGHEFQHHNALEDAKAAGHVLLAALAETGLDLDGALRRVAQPISSRLVTSVARHGAPDGALHGEVIVFTGALQIPRREAADLAATAGCEVSTNVSKKTTLLVVGDVDVKRLAGHEKSSKHRKAEELIAAGVPIRIVRETDFRALVH